MAIKNKFICGFDKTMQFKEALTFSVFLRESQKWRIHYKFTAKLHHFKTVSVWNLDF